MRYGLVEGAHGGRGRAGRSRRYQAGVPYARSPGVRRRWRGRGGRQRELQGQPDRIVERVRVQHAGLLVRHHIGDRRRDDGAGVGAGGVEDPNGRTPLAA